MPKEESNPPEHTIRVGDVELALWRRDGEYGPMYSGKLSRTYRSENNERQNTPYLGAADFNDGIRALSEGVEYISKIKKDYKYQQTMANQRKEKTQEAKTPATESRKKQKAETREPGQD